MTFAKILICMQNSTLEEGTLKANQSQVNASERGAEQHLKRRPRHKQALGADLFISPVDEEVRASSHTFKSCSKQRRQAVNNRLLINSGLRPKSFGAISTAEDRFFGRTSTNFTGRTGTCGGKSSCLIHRWEGVQLTEEVCPLTLPPHIHPTRDRIQTKAALFKHRGHRIIHI